MAVIVPLCHTTLRYGSPQVLDPPRPKRRRLSCNKQCGVRQSRSEQNSQATTVMHSTVTVPNNVMRTFNIIIIPHSKITVGTAKFSVYTIANPDIKTATDTVTGNLVTRQPLRRSSTSVRPSNHKLALCPFKQFSVVSSGRWLEPLWTWRFYPTTSPSHNTCNRSITLRICTRCLER
jgi:hypothetical protein